MGANPIYASTPKDGTLILNNASGTTISSALMTGVTAGTRVNEIRLATGPTTAPGASVVCAIILDDGTNQTVIDIVTLTNLANVLQAVLQYANLILPSGHTIKAIMRTALASGSTLHIAGFGADLT